MMVEGVRRNNHETTKQSFMRTNGNMLERSLSFKAWKSEETVDEESGNARKQAPRTTLQPMDNAKLTISLPEPVALFRKTTPSPLDAAATKLQKVYKSYRTRRNLADCAIVVEELWWKALDFAALKRSSISFFDIEKPESAVSRWARTAARVAKVGKGLLKDEKAQKLALQHWLEAIDPRHRYGHNLHLYYDVWFDSRSTQPFFYWLDVGDGKEVNLETCPRSILQRQCIKYLGPMEREAYEVIVEEGRLIYKKNGALLSTTENSKWIFVLSTSRLLYVGEKKKGAFQHSSFLSGAAITAAGRLVASHGLLEAIWPYSGHYLPTEENFREFTNFLENNNVDLTNVKKCAVDDDYISSGLASTENSQNGESNMATRKKVEVSGPGFDASNRLSCKWSSGVGPRIGCVRDYPLQLQTKALEEVKLSPRLTPAGSSRRVPIPSPRPSPKILVSPRLSYMGFPSPRVPATPVAN